MKTTEKRPLHVCNARWKERERKKEKDGRRGGDRHCRRRRESFIEKEWEREKQDKRLEWREEGGWTRKVNGSGSDGKTVRKRDKE